MMNRPWLNRLAVAFLAATAAFSLLGLAGGVSAWLDLLSHFRFQYFVILTAGGLVLWLIKHPRWALMTGTLAVMNMILFLAYAWPAAHNPSPPLAGRLRILHLNVLAFNRDYGRVDRLIRHSKADVISVQEVTRTWLNALQAQEAIQRFPHQLYHPKSNNLLLSQLPLGQPQIFPVAESRRGRLTGRISGSILTARVQVGGQTVTLLNLHPPVPFSETNISTYQRNLNQLAALRDEIHTPIVLVGDLNTTPWSAFYRQYLQRLGLQDAKRGRYFPTWPTFMPAFAIPIDHVLVSPGITTLDTHPGPFTGSDHLPVYVELGFPAPSTRRPD